MIDLGDAIRNTANSSLTLLYTFALFIWGFSLNRSRAWRTDGGTATFGILALMLGVLGTAVNFVEIREDRMRWLPGVVTCVLLWQSWVGFWWWVGAGMWTGEAEDVERREKKKVRRAEAKRLKKEQREREALGLGANGGSVSGGSGGGATLRRRAMRRTNTVNTTAGEEIELQDLGADGTATPRPRRPQPSHHPSDASVSSGSTPPPSQHFYSPVLAYFAPFFSRLRVAHDAAAVAKAALPPALPDEVRRGWGIKALMLKGKRERGERREAAHGAVREGGERDAGERRAGFEADGGERLGGEEWEDDAPTSDDDEEGEARVPPPSRRGESASLSALLMLLRAHSFFLQLLDLFNRLARRGMNPRRRIGLDEGWKVRGEGGRERLRGGGYATSVSSEVAGGSRSYVVLVLVFLPSLRLLL